MSEGVLVALIAVPVGLLTVYVTYLVSKRQNSGSIQTSEAVDLWAESNALRQEYKNRAEILEARLEEVNAQLQEVMTQLTTLQGKSDNMVKKIDALKKIINSLREENKRLIAEKKKGTV